MPNKIKCPFCTIGNLSPILNSHHRVGWYECSNSRCQFNGEEGEPLRKSNYDKLKKLYVLRKDIISIEEW